MSRRPRIPRLVVAVAAALMLAGAFTSTTHAEDPPFSVYGSGLHAGDHVEVFSAGRSCGTVTADADGNWVTRIALDAPCEPQPGDTVTFTLNGATSAATETFKVGGVPGDVAHGVALASKSGAVPAAVIAAAVAAIVVLAAGGVLVVMRRR